MFKLKNSNVLNNVGITFLETLIIQAIYLFFYEEFRSLNRVTIGYLLLAIIAILKIIENGIYIKIDNNKISYYIVDAITWTIGGYIALFLMDEFGISCSGDWCGLNIAGYWIFNSMFIIIIDIIFVIIKKIVWINNKRNLSK